MAEPQAKGTLGVDGRSGYDVFLSYSHDDREVAAGVQKAMQRIGRRVGRLSSLRVFRDDTDLSASPDLWGRVRQAMDAARFLVVVLSPSAAGSPWVDKEVRHWLATRGPGQLMLVLADGRLAFDGVRQCFDPAISDAAPPVLTEPRTLPTEPLYVDITGEASWDVRDPGFRDRMLTLAAGVHGKSKSALAGEDLREQRRFRWWRRAAIAGLSITTAVAVVAASIAINRSEEAIRQSEEAIRQRNDAVALALAASSERMLGVNDALALALAAEAAAVPSSPRVQAVSALVSARLSLAKQVGLPLGNPLTTEDGSIPPVALSADGKLLAVGGGNDGSIRLWDTERHTQVGDALLGHQSYVSSVAFSSDGELASASNDGAVRLWDPGTHREVGEPLTYEGRHAVSLAFSPDGHTLAIAWEPQYGSQGQQVEGAEGTVVALVDAMTLQVKYEMPVGVGYPSLVFSPDGRRLAVGGTCYLEIWSPSTGRLARQVTTPCPEYGDSGAGGDQAPAFTPDGRLVVPVGDYALALDPVTGKEVGRFCGSPGKGGVVTVATSVSKNIVACADWDQIRLWDLDRGTTVGSPLTSGLIDPGFWMTFSQDGSHLATVAADGVVRLWAVDASEPANKILSGGAVFSADGEVVGASEDGVMHWWDPTTGKETAQLSTGGPLTDPRLAVSGDGTLLVLAGRVGGAQPVTTEYRFLSLPGNTIRTIAKSDDGYVPYPVALTRDGTLLATAVQQENAAPLRLFRTSDGSLVREFSECPYGASQITLDAAGTRIAAACRTEYDWTGSRPHLWDLVTGQELSAPSSVVSVDAVALNPDGTKLATGGLDNAVHLWDAQGQQTGQPLVGHRSAVQAVQFSPDGKLLASAGADGVRLWDPATRQPVGQPLIVDRTASSTSTSASQSASIVKVEFSPDGRSLLTQDSEGTTRIWSGLWDEATGCEIASRYVARAQLDAYLPADWQSACAYR